MNGEDVYRITKPEAAAKAVGIRPSTAKRHLADLRARSGLTTEQLIYCGRAAGWLVVDALEPAEPQPRLERGGCNFERR